MHKKKKKQEIRQCVQFPRERVQYCTYCGRALAAQVVRDGWQCSGYTGDESTHFDFRPPVGRTNVYVLRRRSWAGEWKKKKLNRIRVRVNTYCEKKRSQE